MIYGIWENNSWYVNGIYVVNCYLPIQKATFFHAIKLFERSAKHHYIGCLMLNEFSNLMIRVKEIILLLLIMHVKQTIIIKNSSVNSDNNMVNFVANIFNNINYYKYVNNWLKYLLEIKVIFLSQYKYFSTNYFL